MKTMELRNLHRLEIRADNLLLFTNVCHYHLSTIFVDINFFLNRQHNQAIIGRLYLNHTLLQILKFVCT